MNMNRDISADSPSDAVELGMVLDRLGLGQYEDRLTENGFDTWETVTRITEADLDELGFKLGDRRKLQRAIRKPSTTSTSQCSAMKFPLSFGGLPVIGAQPAEFLPTPTSVTSTKRQYRRHPRADQNAPRRPKTAYVLFSEHVRRDPAVNRLPFAEVAKEVGKRWGNLTPEERSTVWEKPVAEKMREYRAEFERYKLTENYQSYQKYLEDFRQGKQNPDAAERQTATLKEDETHASPQRELGAAHPSSFDSSSPAMSSQNMGFPIEIGMEEVGQMLNRLGVNPQYFKFNPFPPERTTHIAVEAFLHGTGSLLYLWDHDEALDLVKSVYYPKRGSTQLEATELFAMAAIGSYCDGEAITTSIREIFLHFFLSMLCLRSEMSDLRRMRLFSCLAICMFTSRVESARKLILSALEIGRQTFMPLSTEELDPSHGGRYWWNVFRSVVFLESWFAYNTGRESRVTEQDLTLYHPSPMDADSSVESFQHRVGELGRLAACIAVEPEIATKPRVEQARLRLESLNEWHRTLPPTMQLGWLNRAASHTVPWYTKRSLLQLHMLFLGLFNEPYRACLADVGRSRLSETTSELEALDSMKVVEKECVVAARQCARVVSLLQTDNLIRSHCWVSMYTSFTSCSILLFSASQKLLMLEDAEISQDLSFAGSHLNVLSLCSYNSTTARTLCTTLQIVFNDVREIVFSPTYRAMCDRQLVIKHAALVPETYFDAVEGARELSETVLDLAERVIDILLDNITI